MLFCSTEHVSSDRKETCFDLHLIEIVHLGFDQLECKVSKISIKKT